MVTRQKKDASYYAGWKEAIEAVCGWHEEQADLEDDSRQRRHAERILNKFLFKGNDFCPPSEKGKDMCDLKVVGNVYYVGMVNGDDELFSDDHFVAFTAEGAIESAKDWLEREHPDERGVIIGNVKRVLCNVIQ